MPGAAVAAQLQALLHDVRGRDDHVMHHRGRGAARGGLQGLVLGALHVHEPRLCKLVGAKEADVRGDAAGADGDAPAHEAAGAVLAQHLAHDLHRARRPAAKLDGGGLHARLHGVHGVHGDVLHDAGAAARHSVLPEGRGAVPLLPLQRLRARHRRPGGRLDPGAAARGGPTVVEVAEEHADGLVAAPADGRGGHGQHGAGPQAAEEAAGALLRGDGARGGGDAVVLGGAVAQVAALRLEAGLHVVQRQRQGGGQRAANARSEEVPGGPGELGAAAGGVEVQEALQGLVRRHEEPHVGDVHGQGRREAAVERVDALRLERGAHAVHGAGVAPHLQTLLHHVHGRDDGVVRHGGHGPAGRCLQWLMILALAVQEPVLAELVGAEEAYVRRHAAHADDHGAAHEPRRAAFAPRRPEGLQDAELHGRGLDPRLDRVHWVHADVLHDPGAAPRDGMPPEGRGLVPDLPVEQVLAGGIGRPCAPRRLAGAAAGRA
mmetsp:Transcript_82604/g.219269  ORF Transcript_82604/g.219269 Transcript_82604/m.219269 type:complete len:490 (-) Transcript_82604:91-1560(-)